MREDIERGSPISVGDQIKTLSNGHVHVRFADEALVSVRPNSSLVIRRYDYNASAPAESAVKFDLEEGVTRAISGEAAKAARNRFRLNTPIAAIGVRGWIFGRALALILHGPSLMRGAIVIAPYSGACPVMRWPCLDNALELRADDMQLVSMQQDDALPRLIPPQTMRAPDILRKEVQLVVANNNKSVPKAEPSPASSAGDTRDSVEQEVNNEVLLEGITTVQAS